MSWTSCTVWVFSSRKSHVIPTIQKPTRASHTSRRKQNTFVYTLSLWIEWSEHDCRCHRPDGAVVALIPLIAFRKWQWMNRLMNFRLSRTIRLNFPFFSCRFAENENLFRFWRSSNHVACGENCKLFVCSERCECVQLCHCEFHLP